MRKSLAAAILFAPTLILTSPARAATDVEMTVTYAGPGNGLVTFGCHVMAVQGIAVGLITGVTDCTFNGSLSLNLAMFGPYVSTHSVATAQFGSTATACMRGLAFYNDVSVVDTGISCRTFQIQFGGGTVPM